MDLPVDREVFLYVEAQPLWEKRGSAWRCTLGQFSKTSKNLLELHQELERFLHDRLKDLIRSESDLAKASGREEESKENVTSTNDKFSDLGLVRLQELDNFDRIPMLIHYNHEGSRSFYSVKCFYDAKPEKDWLSTVCEIPVSGSGRDIFESHQSAETGVSSYISKVFLRENYVLRSAVAHSTQSAIIKRAKSKILPTLNQHPIGFPISLKLD